MVFDMFCIKTGKQSLLNSQNHITVNAVIAHCSAISSINLNLSIYVKPEWPLLLSFFVYPVPGDRHQNHHQCVPVWAPLWGPAQCATPWRRCMLHNLTPRCVFLPCPMSNLAHGEQNKTLFRHKQFESGAHPCSQLSPPCLSSSTHVILCHFCNVTLTLCALVDTAYGATVPLKACSGTVTFCFALRW